MGPVGASIWLGLLVGIVVYLGVLTIWAHVRSAREFGHDKTGGKVDAAYREKLRPWIRRVTVLYAVGWAIFAWGTLAIGVVEGGAEFLEGRVPLFVVWVLSPGGIAAMAHGYWSLWARTGIPYEPRK